ncbi:transposase [Guyparkeria hydrothermalis]|uniref:REP-associated tyrosine transposase n=1 Tax=Guyparkeria sp. SB14A TaxID=2571147 RepID=UPI001FFC9559|nr:MULTISPECIES: transposase [Guyparkeria]MCL7751308.1 transposase [Guyparkeria hydrothermalis]
MPIDQMRHGWRLRHGRVSIPDQVYSVTLVTRGRWPGLADLSVARRVIGSLREMDETGHSETLAFCLMPDHLHWLFRLRHRDGLSGVVGQFKGRSARRIPLLRWQRGFHDHAARDDVDLRRLARYIVSNPVRAGLVCRVGDYPYWDAVWL